MDNELNFQTGNAVKVKDDFAHKFQDERLDGLNFIVTNTTSIGDEEYEVVLVQQQKDEFYSVCIFGSSDDFNKMLKVIA